MSSNETWDVEKYKDEHETEEHWELRKAFLLRWKHKYPEDRLVCLARVFINIELMGCRYSAEVMKEIAGLSKDVAYSYRMQKKSKLQRTFVSASDAAEDRARGIKREGGIVIEAPATKSPRISFVKQGEASSSVDLIASESDDDVVDPKDAPIQIQDQSNDEKATSSAIDSTLYYEELMRLQCIDVKKFRDGMFNTYYGKLILLIRPWTSKLGNIHASCHLCNIDVQTTYKENTFTVLVNGRVVGKASGENKQIARQAAEAMAWDKLIVKAISVLVKQQYIAQGDTRIAMQDVAGHSSGSADDSFGTPIESSVATKMMQMMGWKGGGLGVESQGIAEPIKPHLQMVNRAGLGSTTSDIKTLKRLGVALMQRYIATSSLDVDLVFSSDFSKEERAALHQCAQGQELASKSYGSNKDRFLVVKKKVNPFALVKAVIQAGGNTVKYQVFIPVALSSKIGNGLF